MTGSISEEEFKALHQHTKDEPPKLEGTMIEVGGARAYLSRPAGVDAPVPGIVVIHEWWGLNDNVKHWSDRLAAEGYAALAVDLYGGEVATEPDGAMELMKGVDQEQALAILDAARRYLSEDAAIQAPKVASIGWCFGGGYSLRLAIADPELAAAVVYYGFPVLDEEELGRIEANMLLIYADRDKSIPPAKVQALDAALTKVGVTHELHTYDADHAFANPSNAVYDHDAASKAWAEVKDFLKSELR